MVNKKEHLESGLVFIDTSSFESKNFQFGQHVLGRIEEFVKQSYIRVLLPDVINSEIEKHLALRLDESLGALKKVRKELVFLRNLSEHSCAGLFAEVDKDLALKCVLEKFYAFRSHDDVEMVSTEGVCSKEVFERYFSERPPFGSAGKKHEFPDAFALESIRNISKKRAMPVYVVSSDKDMEAYCKEFPENLIYLERIEELVGLVNRFAEDLAKPSELAVGAFLNIKSKVDDALKKIFEEAEYSCEDLSEIDYEVSDVDVYSVDVESYNVISADVAEAEIELTVKLEVAAVYSVTDYDNSPWDPEDKCYLYLDSYNIEKVHRETVQVYLFLTYEGGLKSNADIHEIWLDDSLIDLSFKNAFDRPVD